MKISAAIARLAMEGRTPSEVTLVDRITTFVAREPHAFLGSGAFLALGRRLKEAGIQPVDGEQVDIAPFAGAITLAEVREVWAKEQPAAAKPPMEYPQVLARVWQIVAAHGEANNARVEPDDTLESLGFTDSLAIVELVLALEEHFEVEIPEGYPGLDAVKTVEDLARICEKVLLGAGKVADHDAPVHVVPEKAGIQPIQFSASVSEDDPSEAEQLQELIELFRSAPIADHPSVSEQWAKLVLSRYRLIPRKPL